MKRRTWILGAAGLLVVGGVSAYVIRNGKETVKWRQGKVDRGNLTQKISATGTVSAMVQVAVGTQVSGVISALYADYNSLVKKGQIIAQIDPTVWETQLRDAQATLERTTANMEDAKRQYDRAKRLAAEKLLSDQELDTRKLAYATAKASMENSQAALERAKANLAYCNITAPVDGVVIARMADVGQTVAASFSTPNLFQIAQDLSKMKVEVSIDEADIDEVKPGQKAFFTVDSLPERQFEARVSQVRLEPITTQNVVTYKVVLEVPNEPLEGGSEFRRRGAGPENRSPGAEGRARETEGQRPGTVGRGRSQEGRPEGGRGFRTGGADGAHGGGPAAGMDPEKAWERMKDRLPEGMTKEAFLQRFKERMARRADAEPPAAKRPVMDREAAARTPGGAAFLAGPVFGGNLALRPGMTANVTIQTRSRENVLKVPNVALRFNPAAFQKDEKKAEGPRMGGLGQPMMIPGRSGGPRPGGPTRREGIAARREDKIWILENGQPKPIPVRAGLTDGQSTEISGEGIQEGMQILLGVEDTKKATGNGPAPSAGGMGGGGRR